MRTPPWSLAIHCALALCLASSVPAQDRQGNIVEYFGKEKVNAVREGKVIHVFKKGLILPGNRSSFNSESTPKQPLVARVLLDDVFSVEEGTEEGVDRRGNPMKWETVLANDKSQFDDRRLRSGYLYLEYESSGSDIVIFEASGHTRTFINGMPHEGDHYDYGWSLIPIRLQQGRNRILLTGGRFPRMRARLLAPEKPVQLITRDMTLPDILMEEDSDLLGAIRIVNATDDWFKGGRIVCEVLGVRRSTKIPNVSPLNSRKVPFNIPTPEDLDEDRVTASITLEDDQGTPLSTRETGLRIRSRHKHHKRTFISEIDGSVQYYSIAPSSDPDVENPALFLSVHGASVEAVSQARAYKQKKWGHLAAPTNRRPFGFAWEDWGRLDALEVLHHAETLLKTDRRRTYLTGHSMGGHGTWYLGATYPDRFAAIAPAAGYPDLLGYRKSFRRRLRNATDEDLKRFGMTRERASQLLLEDGHSDPVDKKMDAMIRRAGNPSRTLKLRRNYLHHGVYVLHGEKDTVVPTFLAREMREVLAKFHPDFTYYEYPGGTHWYGNRSVDWKPLFDFFEFRQIKPADEIKKVEFYTASPGVSATSHFITIHQQIIPFEIASFHFERGEIPGVTTTNVSALAVDLKKMGGAERFRIDDQEFEVAGVEKAVFKLSGETWARVDDVSKAEKGPHRYGGFKDAFRNRMVFVHATKGSEVENAWYYNRARHDAETFWYRANGNVEIVRDVDFHAESFGDRNVILYGNADNNAAWKLLLGDCPLQVSNGKIKLGEKTFTGDRYGGFFTYPRRDSDHASIGAVTATGIPGMKAAYANLYLLNGTSFPDVLIFDDSVLRDGIRGVKVSGFFGNDWSWEKGDFAWR